MTSLTPLRRLAILLALLPQLLVLGLGSGVVVCVTPDGHLQLEVSGSDCCEELAAPSGDKGSARSQGRSDCGPCTDFAIVLDQRRSKDDDGKALRFPSTPLRAMSLQAPLLAGPKGPGRAFGLPATGVAAPPHLIHLRSVLLRC
jgi:hypothetical protein